MNDPYTNIYPFRVDGRRFDTGRGQARFAGPLLLAWLRFRWWLIESKAIRHLESLDDRLLDDVGIERSAIDATVRGLAEPRPGLAGPVEERDATDHRRQLAA